MNDASNSQSEQPSEQRSKGLGIKDVLQTVFAAALGVQSSKNRERDFKQGNIGVFIAAGIVFTALFIGGVVTVVQLVIANQ